MVGIDKIEIATPAYTLKKYDSEHFGLNRSLKQGDSELPYLMTTGEGEEIFANKMFHNSEVATFDINQRGMLISFNPSKYYHQYHLMTDVQQLNAVTEDIQQELEKVGIDTDMSEARIVRLDLTKQAEMIHPISNYAPLFSFLKGKRLTSKQYPSGFNFGNKSSETVFYDKREEIWYKHKEQIAEKNFLRAEVKWKKPKPVATDTGLITYSDLMNIDSETLTESYDNYLNKRLFSKQYEGQQLAFNYTDELEIFKHCYLEEHKRGAVGKYLSDLGLETAILRFGNLQNLRAFLLDAGMRRETVWRNIELVRERMQKKAFLDSRRSEVSVTSLLMEVQDKFAV